MSAIDVDATMAPMNYEVMTDNEPILGKNKKTKQKKKSKNKKKKTKTKKKKNKNKINLGPTFIWHILAINLGPMHQYAAGSSPSSNMKMTSIFVLQFAIAFNFFDPPNLSY